MLVAIKRKQPREPSTQPHVILNFLGIAVGKGNASNGKGWPHTPAYDAMSTFVIHRSANQLASQCGRGASSKPLPEARCGEQRIAAEGLRRN